MTIQEKALFIVAELDADSPALELKNAQSGQVSRISYEDFGNDGDAFKIVPLGDNVSCVVLGAQFYNELLEQEIWPQGYGAPEVYICDSGASFDNLKDKAQPADFLALHRFLTYLTDKANPSVAIDKVLNFKIQNMPFRDVVIDFDFAAKSYISVGLAKADIPQSNFAQKSPAFSVTDGRMLYNFYDKKHLNAAQEQELASRKRTTGVVDQCVQVNIPDYSVSFIKTPLASLFGTIGNLSVTHVHGNLDKAFISLGQTRESKDLFDPIKFPCAIRDKGASFVLWGEGNEAARARIVEIDGVSSRDSDLRAMNGMRILLNAKQDRVYDMGANEREKFAFVRKEIIEYGGKAVAENPAPELSP